jgi:hypothetical protein
VPISAAGSGRRLQGTRAVPLALRRLAAFHGEGDQKKHDSNDIDEVRHPGKRTGYVAGVRPDETDNRPDDEQKHHRG